MQTLCNHRPAFVLSCTCGSRIAQCNHGRLKRKRLCPRNALHVIADMDGAAAQDTGKHTFPRHDAVPNALIDGAMRVTFFANLRDFQQNFAAL